MIELKVAGADEEDDTYDKSIKLYTLTDVNDYSLTLDITFNKASDITPILFDPDTLQIRFKVRQLIIDADTFEPLSQEEAQLDLDL